MLGRANMSGNWDLGPHVNRPSLLNLILDQQTLRKSWGQVACHIVPDTWKESNNVEWPKPRNGSVINLESKRSLITETIYFSFIPISPQKIKVKALWNLDEKGPHIWWVHLLTY